MKSVKCLSLLILALSLASCVVVPCESYSYSCGLVPEIEVTTNGERKDTLCINNISGKRIQSVKLVYVEATFDEAKKHTEPNWDEYENALESSFIPNNDSAKCDLEPKYSLKTLWVKVDTSDRHCVFAIVYEAGCCIDVNIRKSDT